MIREQGRFPFTDQDLERAGIYRRLAGLERLVAWEEWKKVGLALFIVKRTGSQKPELGVCIKCPCGEGNWVGHVVANRLERLHISGEQCTSDGFDRQAERMPLILLTDEQKHKLADAYPNNPDIARIFLMMATTPSMISE